VIGALSTLARAVAGLAPLVRLAPRPDARPMGVSALVRVKDEEEWVEASLRSLEGFADEIIVIDNGSTDSTLDRVRALGPTLATELRAEAAALATRLAGDLLRRNLTEADQRRLVDEFVARVESSGADGRAA